MRPFRWVPSADGFARRSLRRRSGRIPPLGPLIAPTRSAWSAKSHLTQAKTACDLRLSLEIWPQDGHVREVFWGGTARNRPPAQSILYSSCRRNSAQPWSSIDRLSPAFARTFLPGCSNVRLADRDMFFPCKSSTTTIAWFLLMVVEVLCRSGDGEAIGRYRDADSRGV
jgi:hypothetical protein